MFSFGQFGPFSLANLDLTSGQLGRFPLANSDLFHRSVRTLLALDSINLVKPNQSLWKNILGITMKKQHRNNKKNNTFISLKYLRTYA